MICRPFGHYSPWLWVQSTRMPCQTKWIAWILIARGWRCPGNRFEAARLCYSPQLIFDRRGHR